MNSQIAAWMDASQWTSVLNYLKRNYGKMNLREDNILQRAAAEAPTIRPFLLFFSIDMTDGNGRTAVWCAAARGRADNLQALLENDANPNLADHQGRSPIFVAANPEVATLLTNFGADLQCTDNQGNTPLEYLAAHGRNAIAEQLRKLPAPQADAPQNNLAPFISAPPAPTPQPDKPEDYGSRFDTIHCTPKLLRDCLDSDETTLHGIIVDGERFHLSNRFLKSMATRLKVPYAVFSLFTPLEVIHRAAERNPEMSLRLTLDHAQNEALALVEDKGNVLPIAQVTDILRQDSRLQKLDYGDGVIEATLDLNDGWSIPGDSDYRVQLSCQIPVDGLAQPAINLATFRLVCSNGAVAQESSFHTKMEIKDNSGLHFSKLLRSFSNRSGMELLHQRLIDANQTKASVNELLEVDNLLHRNVSDRKNQILLREQLLTLGNNPCAQYGVTDLNNIAEKKRPLLPVDCSVADLLNFVSELGTHHRELLSKTEPLATYHGRMLAKSFDLEDMYRNTVPARRFHLDNIDFEATRAQPAVQ